MIQKKVDEMFEKEVIQNFIDNWKNCNSHTIEFASKVPAGVWNTKPFDPYYKSFAWEFACIARTRACYIKGLKKGVLNFGMQDGVPSKEEFTRIPKKKSIDIMRKQSKEFVSILKDPKINSTNVLGKKKDKLEIISMLMQHERLHHGKLILYFSKAGLKYPDSFVKTWGESNFK